MGSGDGDAGWCVEWVKPIDEVEASLRRQGIFLLVDADGRKLRFYGYSRNNEAVNRAVDSLKGRQGEMVKFLTARARAKGETT